MEGFGTVLGGTDGFVSVSEDGWENRSSSWGKREWEIWETWGWYRHFCREVRVCPFARLPVADIPPVCTSITDV